MQRITTTVFNNGDPIPEAKTIQEFNVVFQDVKTPYFIRLNGCVFYNKYAVDDARGIIPPGHRFPDVSDVLDIPKNGYILETDLHHSTGTKWGMAGCWLKDNTMVGTYKNVPSAQAIVVDYDNEAKVMAMPQNWGFEVYAISN